MTKILPAEVNVWFHYGSFSYGIECVVKTPPLKNSLMIELLQPLPPHELEEIGVLLELMVADAPRALLSLHVSFFEEGTNNPRFHLSTVYAPTLIQTAGNLCPLLRAEGLSGVSVDDEKLWKAWQTQFE